MLSDKLHDEIDDIETLSSEARDIVRARMGEMPGVLEQLADAEETWDKGDLPEILVELAAAVGPGFLWPSPKIWGGFEYATQIIAHRVAGDMDALTTRAARQGIAAGRKRVAA